MTTNPISLLVAALLLASSVAKLTAPSSRHALAAFGLGSSAARSAAWAGAIVVEVGCACAIVLGPAWALLVAAALFGAFAVLHARAIGRGDAGRACGCLGRRGRISWGAVAANGASALLAVLAFVTTTASISERTAVVAGFAVVGVALAALGIAVVALAREVGVLRLALGARGALEIPDEGPALGSAPPRRPWPAPGPEAELTLAVLVSDGCPMCRTLGPSISFLAGDPRLHVVVLDEERDRDAWDVLQAPGAPYAVVLDDRGVVLAKGVCNSLPHLESVVATAVRRREEAVHA